jgi:hypothetical protein
MASLGYAYLNGPSQLSTFFIFSHLPLLSFSGIVGLILFAFLRPRATEETHKTAAILVSSIWAVQNTQITSGVLVTPVNFENYWGVAVLGCLTTLVVIHRATEPRIWITSAFALFVAFAGTTFAFNRSIFLRLEDPKKTIAMLATSSSQVACDDRYLATNLDLVHPLQPPTAFSWTRTYDLSSNQRYDQYLCARDTILHSGHASSPKFKELFEALDRGFQTRGADMFMSLGRQPIPTFTKREFTQNTRCAPEELIVVTTK